MTTNIKLGIHTQEPSHSNPRNLWRDPKQAAYMTQEFKQKKQHNQKKLSKLSIFSVQKTALTLHHTAIPMESPKKPTQVLTTKQKKYKITRKRNKYQQQNPDGKPYGKAR